MLPTEQFSGDAVPQVPWTPPVWQEGPDALVAQARLDLFQYRADVEVKALGDPDMAMAGGQTSPTNESERIIDGSTRRPLKNHWDRALTDLRATEPLYGRSGEVSGAHEQPTANPNA